MRNWTEFHTANKESVARWIFDCGYEDLKEPGKMKVDDLIACDWLTLKGYMPYEMRIENLKQLIAELKAKI